MQLKSCRFPQIALALLTLAAVAAAAPAERRIAERVVPPGLKIEATSSVPTSAGTAMRVMVSFEYVDPAGAKQQAKGKLFLPAGVLANPSRKAPLLYSAGYEMADPDAKAYLENGCVVVTPLSHPLNPMSRLPNLDAALLKLARALNCVDDARVVIFGGSAGGYTTLMLAAETFPVSAAVALVPPIDWSYNTRYFMANYERIKPPAGKPGQSPVPFLAAVAGMLIPQRTTYYPPDVEDRAWTLNSPISQLDTITCPVLAIFSTGDMLVPVYQVSRQFVRPLDPARFPPGFEADPRKLLGKPELHPALLDRLGRDRYTLTVVPADPSWPDPARPAPGGAKKQAGKKKAAGPPTWIIPAKSEKSWDIVVLDEGPMAPLTGHFRLTVAPNFDGYLKARLAAPLLPEQLSAKKLERLMTRYSGMEWQACGLHRLDRPEAERADVLRGLITYVSQGEAHARHFAELYAALPRERQALGQAERFSSPDQVRSVLESLRKS